MAPAYAAPVHSSPARGRRSMTDIALASGVPVETLRKIEAGRIPTPAFFTIVALAAALGLPLDRLVQACADEPMPEAVAA